MQFNNNDNILYIIITVGGISSSTLPSESSYVQQHNTSTPIYIKDTIYNTPPTQSINIQPTTTNTPIHIHDTIYTAVYDTPPPPPSTNIPQDTIDNILLNTPSPSSITIIHTTPPCTSQSLQYTSINPSKKKRKKLFSNTNNQNILECEVDIVNHKQNYIKQQFEVINKEMEAKDKRNEREIEKYLKEMNAVEEKERREKEKEIREKEKYLKEMKGVEEKERREKEKEIREKEKYLKEMKGVEEKERREKEKEIREKEKYLKEMKAVEEKKIREEEKHLKEMLIYDLKIKELTNKYN